MATKKTRTKAATQAKSDPDFLTRAEAEDTPSQWMAKLSTTSALSALTLKNYAGGGDALEMSDLMTEMQKAGSEAVAGDLSRVERMLVNQLLTLDAIFNNLAQRSGRQDNFKGIEVMMRLALKAQAQARATAETLSVIKNPMPYIKQANIAHGHQQVINGQQATGAGNFKNEPNKLLEAQHGDTLDIGAQATAGRADQVMATLGKVHRAKDA